MSNDPFTLDMFGSSALSSGLGLGVTAFGGFEPVAANDDDPEPTPPSPAPALPVTAKERPPRRQGNRSNFYLDDSDRGLAASWKERARVNVAAILLAGAIEKQALSDQNIPCLHRSMSQEKPQRYRHAMAVTGNSRGDDPDVSAKHVALPTIP